MPLSSSERSTLLADVKQHLNISGGADDGEVLRKVDAAVELVEDVVGPLEVLSTTETVNGWFQLSGRPVHALTSATYNGSDVTAAVTVTRDGQVFGARTGTTIAYMYGRPTPTPAQRQVLMEVVRRAWRGTQQGYRPGYGEAPDGEGGLPPALLLTRADREALGVRPLAPLGFA